MKMKYHEKYLMNGFEIVRAENIYMTDNLAAGDRFTKGYCRDYPTDTLHCPGAAALTLTLGRNISYRAFAFEEYWMRKTASSGKYVNAKTGTPVRDLYGFGSFKWFEGRIRNQTIWDAVKNDGTQSRDDGRGNQVYTMEKCVLDKWNNILSCGN